ncbi:hypothetical protein IX339_000681 [Porphyromonas levii]|uniref:DMT family transporter n=1 Tax=Porphyromonas levii TaxID=28114 RepID=UPI001B8B1462|nr:DMT family transporter [Porphyromonas levii]MBR8731239.1 hypothetical protein [Porphyromonas levii]
MRLSNHVKGYAAALLSANTFGLIPLFTVPLMREGMSTESILVYRFAIAAVVVALIMLFKGISFRETGKHIRLIFALSILYFLCAHFLISGYRAMPSGVATVIHFLYPIMVALLMLIFFGQKLNRGSMLALVLGFIGVVFLSGIMGESGFQIALVDIGLVAFSGFCYAVYIVMINRSRADQIPMWRLTFYLMVFSTIFFGLVALGKQELQLPQTPSAWGLLALLGIVPTIISNILLITAIPRIGSTATSIMGVLEPVTAVLVGVLILGESLSFSTTIGIGIILIAVALQITSSKSQLPS